MAGGSLTDALKVAGFSALQAGTWVATGSLLNAMSANLMSKAIVHGVVGGTLSVAQGGDFKDGFISAVIPKLIAINSIEMQTAFFTKMTRTMVAAVVGGSAAALTGGNFANGAVTAAFAQMFNDIWHDFEQEVRHNMLRHAEEAGLLLAGVIPIVGEETVPLGAAMITEDLGLDLGEEIGILRDAAKGKGNFGLGSATREEADSLGKSWVGEGARVSSDGKALVSKDALRQYRIGYKPRLGRSQANFERKFLEQRSNQWQSNGHLDIRE